MIRLLLFLSAGALASGCGSATDDRPATLEFITETILSPSCAAAQCHSSFRAQVGDVFDTPEATRRTIVVNHLVNYPDEVGDPAQSRLIRTLTIGAESILGDGLVRMPYDSPIPDPDVELIRAWIAGGLHGAQCEPNEQGRGCRVRSVTVGGQLMIESAVVECTDGEAGAVVQICATSCNFGSGTCAN